MTANQPHQPSDGHKLKQLHKIITDATAAFMVTRGANQELHGRPMASAQVDQDLASIWFATDRHSGKVEEIAAEPRVYLGYTNGSGSEWASINGTARVVDDRAKVNELWSPLWKNWFDGPEDPRIVLIEVTPTDAEYWDSGSRLVMLAKMAAAAVTGAKLPEGEHESINVSRTFSEDGRRAV